MGSDPMSQNSAEDRFIKKWFAPLAGAEGLSLRDDAGLYQPPPGHELVLTVDTLVAGVHFFAEDPAASLARKILRVNLSDLAAKGAEPAGFLLSFAMPQGDSAYRSDDWLSKFSQALGEDAKHFACPLIGGDTVSIPGPLTLSVTALGIVPAGKMVLRTGAQPGDVIAVTGTIGDAALGLRELMDEKPDWLRQLPDTQRNHLVNRYREPNPRVSLAPALRDHANGAMDVSDGLAGDLAKMMNVSGVSARIALDKVPFSPAAQAAVASDPSCLDAAVTGGDDYEILCTLPAARVSAVEKEAERNGYGFTVIGNVIDKADDAAVFMDGKGQARTFGRGSYSHL